MAKQVIDSTPHREAFTLCVFCGASQGASPRYMEGATALAEAMGAKSWSLVYGGGTLGLMGTLAKSLVRLSGPDSVHGVIPEALIRTERGVAKPNVAEYGNTTVVHSMHERKAIMVAEANAFVALPGGYGTMEELFEVATWNQLGIHDRPVVLFNIGGFFDHLIAWLNNSVDEGFISKGTANIISVANTADEVVEKILQYELVAGRHLLDWNSKDTTKISAI
ncbi:hypothetical protein FBEOM_12297 [Fusarium beomiforme]|uniref:Cytokinin riboside 5'-monophosphate phosphoribohydrolase n=1 Tax=Fusarium beomiforme TaxID=44412 RepID=A0A9P5A926_9HYPO|nr:hypothetical protein FBEOM_12297 [Fusarium beomiforme]